MRNIGSVSNDAPESDYNELLKEIQELTNKITELEGRMDTQKAEINGDIRELRASVGGSIGTLKILIVSVIIPFVVALSTALIVQVL